MCWHLQKALGRGIPGMAVTCGTLLITCGILVVTCGILVIKPSISVSLRQFRHGSRCDVFVITTSCIAVGKGLVGTLTTSIGVSDTSCHCSSPEGSRAGLGSVGLSSVGLGSVGLSSVGLSKVWPK